jgi:hypothetical protein
MPAATLDLGRLPGSFAICAAVVAAFFRRAIARRMGTFLVFGHNASGFLTIRRVEKPRFLIEPQPTNARCIPPAILKASLDVLQLKENAFGCLAVSISLANIVVIGRAVLNSVIEYSWIRGQACDGELVYVSFERPVIEYFAGDIVQPDTLA